MSLWTGGESEQSILFSDTDSRSGRIKRRAWRCCDIGGSGRLFGRSHGARDLDFFRGQKSLELAKELREDDRSC